MGLYRVVNMDLACQRCGRVGPADVQFKTGDDWLQEYTLGAPAHDLPANEEWEGIADRFCEPCQQDHRAERERAMAAVAAELVCAARIELKLTETAAPLTAEDILQRGEEKGAATRKLRAWFGTPLVLADLWFRADGGGWLPPARIRDPWWPRLYRALGEEMRRRGWPAGDDTFREDLIIHLDEQRQIQVRLLEARRP